MQLGTYTDGRPLTYDEATGGFLVGDAPVTAEQVRAYEAAGQLVWSRPDIASWFHSSFPTAAPVVAEKKPRNTALVVIVIVAILGFLLLVCGVLAAIAIPVFSSAKEDAQMRQCFANERTIEGAAEMCEVETGEIPASVGGMVPEYLAEEPMCPIAGAFANGVTTGVADCAEHGHF